MGRTGGKKFYFIENFFLSKTVKPVKKAKKIFSKIFWAARFKRVGQERGNKTYVPAGLDTHIHSKVYKVVYF